MFKRGFPRIFLGLLAVSALSACGDPCKALSEQVCGCMPTLLQQQQCTARVDTLAGQYKSSSNSTEEQAGLNLCSQKLDTCTCDALAAGDLEACGLAKE